MRLRGRPQRYANAPAGGRVVAGCQGRLELTHPGEAAGGWRKCPADNRRPACGAEPVGRGAAGGSAQSRGGGEPRSLSRRRGCRRCCSCGGSIEHVRTAYQHQEELPKVRPHTAVESQSRSVAAPAAGAATRAAIHSRHPTPSARPHPFHLRNGRTLMTSVSRDIFPPDNPYLWRPHGGRTSEGRHNLTQDAIRSQDQAPTT